MSVRPSRRGSRALALLCLLSLLPSVALADDVADEAELYFRIAAEKFVARDFRGALEYFLRSNRLVRNRNVMFNIAKSYEQLGQVNDAFRYYSLALEGETDEAVKKSVSAALAALRARVALVEVETDPPGATIYIDRKDLGARGAAPRALAFAPGKILVLADMPGHEDAVPIEVKLEVGKTARVKLTLKRILGTVQLEEAPEGLSASVDGGPFEPVTGGAVGLPPGRHQLTLRLPGHQDDIHLIDVAANATSKLKPRLQPMLGSLVVATDERDAEIRVDGRQVGFTPAVVPVPVGKHRVSLRLPGYREVVQEVEISTGEPVRIEADLRGVEEVSAVSRVTEAVEDAPSSVTVLSRQDLRAFGFPTLAESLRGLRGFYVSDSRSYHSVGVRGFSRLGDYGQRTLVLLDGYATNDNYIGSSYIGIDNRVDLEDIERIEVIRGPGSVVYGTNAFFGVINMVPRQGRGRTGGEVGLSLFDYGLARGRARADVAISKDASAWISVMGARGSGRDFSFPELASGTTDGTSRGADGVRAATGQANLRWKDLTVQGFYTSREKNVPTGGYGTLLGDNRTRLRDTRGFVELRYEPRVSENVQLLTRAHADLYNFQGSYAYPVTDGGLGQERFEGRWFGGELRVMYNPSNQLRIMVGGEGKVHTKAQLRGQDETQLYLSDNHPFQVAGGYFSGDWAPSKLVRISAGARLDYFSTFAGVSLNPRLALLLHPTERSTLKVIGAKAFRAPSVYEFYYNDDGRTQVASTNLKPEEIYSGEVEFTQRLSSATTLTASAFASTVTDLITPRGTGSDADPIFYENSRVPTLIVGAEGEARRDWRQGWMVSVSGSVQRASYRQEAGDAVRLREVPDSPLYLASIRGGVPLLSRALTLASRLSIEGPRFDRLERSTEDPQGKSEAAAIWDLMLSGEETRYGISYAVGVYNLFDWRYRLPLSSEFSQRRLVQNGRTALASLKVAF
jgi:outer membrane receptor protein involved in Fe transport